MQRLHRESLLARPRRVRAAGHDGGFAGSLLKRFAGDIEQQLLSLLRFLAPITTGVGLMRAI